MRLFFGIAIALLLSSFAAAEFLAGYSEGKISVLCEGEREIFVSTPSGGAQRMALGDGFQAEIAAGEAGPYSVQCGKEVKTVSVERDEWKTPFEGKQEDAPYAAVAFAVFAASLLALAVFMAHRSLGGRATFGKIVDGNRVALEITAGRELLSVEIDDPQVDGGKISVPKIAAGKTWRLQYEADGKAMPARMSANDKGKGIVMDARLMVDGKEVESGGAVPAATPTIDGKDAEERKTDAPFSRKLKRAE